MAEWIEPKTDWVATDYLNIGDYNRIIGNLEYLAEYASTLLDGITLTELGKRKTYTDPIYAREMNAIEQALERINKETYGFSIGETPTYRANKPTPLWSEYNRIEGATLIIGSTAFAQEKAKPRLTFTLGNQRGVR